MSEEQVLKIPAELERMDEVLNFVGSLIDPYGPTPQARMQLRMAMEELYVNVAHYAYPADGGWVEVRGSVEDGVATFRLIDGGVPFNPLAKPDPDVTLPGEEREIGGLGIYMVKSTMDEVEYEYRDGCNQLTIRKRICAQHRAEAAIRASAPATRETAERDVMLETKIYIGMNDKRTLEQTLDNDKYISILKRVCHHYHVPFSFTLSNGGYFMDNEEYVEEQSLILSLIDVDEHTINEIAKDLCVFFNQESVLITENAIHSYYIREELPDVRSDPERVGGNE